MTKLSELLAARDALNEQIGTRMDEIYAELRYRKLPAPGADEYVGAEHVELSGDHVTVEYRDRYGDTVCHQYPLSLVEEGSPEAFDAFEQSVKAEREAKQQEANRIAAAEADQLRALAAKHPDVVKQLKG